MRYAIISDVHSNLESLTAVLEDIKKNNIIEVLFTGDAVGYGPDPDECLKIIENECKALIAGNHDWAVLGLIDITFFNPVARIAIEWTRERIAKENIELLRGFKLTESLTEENIFLVHSTPREPERWGYLLTKSEIAENFNHFSRRICFVGHSHIPFIAKMEQTGEIILYKKRVLVSENARYIVNAGSVGQPRDGDPRACYCIFDEGVIFIRRVEYDVSKTQIKMAEKGLPTYLIERLSYGV